MGRPLSSNPTYVSITEVTIDVWIDQRATKSRANWYLLKLGDKRPRCSLGTDDKRQAALLAMKAYQAWLEEMLAQAGIPVPNESGSILGIPRYPPLAGQWADPSVEIPGWIVLSPGTPPRPGDVVAEKINYSDASGHVGIVVARKDGTGVETMSVGSHTRPETVKRTDFGFRSNEQPVFRRYVGPGVPA